MGPDLALLLYADLLWNAVLVCLPILVVTLVVGLLVSILQVVTQIQDMSLTFIPKTVATVLALTTFGPWMLRKIIAYASNLIASIPGQF